MMLDRETLLKQITITDFMAVDLQLFLNTHPQDAEALQMYNDTVARSMEMRDQYEAMYGPLVSFRSPGTPDWGWKDSPWPWQEKFNFDFAECVNNGNGNRGLFWEERL